MKIPAVSAERTAWRTPSGAPCRYSWRRMRAPRRGRQSGFSLIEMIVATLLMSVAIVGLLALTSGAMSNAARVREYERAAMLARSQMNELLVIEPLPIGTPLAGDFGTDWGWEALAEPFEAPPSARPGVMMLVRVHLTIWWNSENRRKTIELDGYRRIRIRPEDDLSRLQ